MESRNLTCARVPKMAVADAVALAMKKNTIKKAATLLKIVDLATPSMILMDLLDLTYMID